jgi:hypothetical protein
MDDMNIDIETTSQRTHISIINLNYLFNYEFEKLNEFKTNSFISIIQREMGYDLEELKAAAQSYYKSQINDPSILIKEYKENRPKKSNKNLIIISLIAILILIYIVYSIFISNNSLNNYTPNESISKVQQEEKEEPKNDENTDLNTKEIIQKDELNKEKIQDIKVENEPQINKTQEEKIVENIDTKKSETISIAEPKKEEESIKEQAVEPTLNKLVLKSNKKVWIGITYLDTLKSDDFTTKEYTFDPKRDFVAVFGHNHIKILLNDEVIDFKNDMDKRRISYIDGKVNIITKKKLNKIIKKYKANK